MHSDINHRIDLDLAALEEVARGFSQAISDPLTGRVKPGALRLLYLEPGRQMKDSFTLLGMTYHPQTDDAVISETGYRGPGICAIEMPDFIASAHEEVNWRQLCSRMRHHLDALIRSISRLDEIDGDIQARIEIIPGAAYPIDLRVVVALGDVEVSAQTCIGGADHLRESLADALRMCS